jgi:hypothetical protein
MRTAIIALIGSLLTIPAIVPANSQTSAPGISQTATIEFSAATKKKAPKKMKKEKVEYMRSAAPPEPKK